MLEKTQFNACRIGYLDALSPGCKFIHLVRDGVDVVRIHRPPVPRPEL